MERGVLRVYDELPESGPLIQYYCVVVEDDPERYRKHIRVNPLFSASSVSAVVTTQVNQLIPAA